MRLRQQARRHCRYTIASDHDYEQEHGDSTAAAGWVETDDAEVVPPFSDAIPVVPRFDFANLTELEAAADTKHGTHNRKGDKPHENEHEQQYATGDHLGE